MRILIAGATGVLGRRLVHQLSTNGRDVLGLTRNERGDEVVREQGGQPVRADLFQSDEIVRTVETCDAIIHAATAIPKTPKPSSADWEINDRIRIHGIQALADVSWRTGAQQLIFQSIVWVARPDDQSPFDEDSPTNPDDVTRSAAIAEKIALDSAEQYGFTTTILRGGWFYAPDSYHTRSFGEALRKRMLPVVGSGEARWSILHADDAASAYAAAIEKRPEGIYHVVDDQPVQVGDFFQYFAERLGAKPPRRVPIWLARRLGGRFAAEFATTSMITSADRFKASTGWQPQYPDYRAGLDQVVSTWESNT